MGHRFDDRSSIAAKSIQILPRRFFLNLLVGFLAQKELLKRKTRRASLFPHKLHVLCIQLLSHVSTYLYNTQKDDEIKYKNNRSGLENVHSSRYCRIGVANNSIGFFFSHSARCCVFFSMLFRIPSSVSSSPCKSSPITSSVLCTESTTSKWPSWDSRKGCMCSSFASRAH